MAKNQRFAVIGLGRFGLKLARSLSRMGAEVIAVDRNPKHVEEVRDEVTHAVRLDSTDPEALRAQGIHEVDVAVVGIGADFESSAMAVVTLKSLGVKHIVARARKEMQARILRSVGAHEIALPENESAVRWSHRLTLPNLKEYVELGDDYSMVYMTAPEEFANKTLLELDLRNKHGVTLVAIQRKGPTQKIEETGELLKPIVTVPAASTKILKNDVLIIVGSNESLSRLPSD